MYLTRYQAGVITRRDCPGLDALSPRIAAILEQMAKRGHALHLSPHVVELTWLLRRQLDQDEEMCRLAFPGAEHLPPAWRAGLARWLEVRRPTRRTAASILVCGVFPILVPLSGIPWLSPQQRELLLWLYPSPYRPLTQRDWRMLRVRHPELRGELKHCSPIPSNQTVYADLTLV